MKEMRDTIEKMFLMTTDEVLDLFASLPGAVEGDKYVYIPGNREKRVLLVGHADTVFANPPKSVEWNGYAAKAGYTAEKNRSLEPAGPIPVGPRTPKPPPKEDRTLERLLANETITITIGEKSFSLPEYTTLKAEGKLPKSGGSTTPTTVAENAKYNSSRRQGYPAGLGADDRAGCSALWLLRNSGHSILICDVEEIGGVGAKSAGKALAEEISTHQFAIEIDRAGDQEMVFYDVSTPEFEKYMQETTGGFDIGRGSYTDIKDVCAAGGICGVNMAAGYLFQHTDKEMFFFDFWLRTFNAVSRILEGEVPRFELPKHQPAGKSVSVVPGGYYDDVPYRDHRAGRSLFEDSNFEGDYEPMDGASTSELAWLEYERQKREAREREEELAEVFGSAPGPKDLKTPINLLHKLDLEPELT